MQKNFTIDYLTEDPIPEYVKALKSAKTAKELVEAITPYKLVAKDALRVAKTMKDEEIKVFQQDWKKAKKENDVEWIDNFNKRYGIIVMPQKMVAVSLLALQFGAPWGTAYIRMEEIKKIK